MNAELFKDLQDGSEKALQTVYDKYSRLVLYVINHIIMDIETSNEILNDVFLTVYEKAKKLQNYHAFQSWLCKVAKNLALRAVSRHKRYINMDFDAIMTRIKDDSANHQVEWLLIQEVLTEKELNIVIKKHLYNYTLQKIADIENIAFHQVSYLYYRAVKKVKSQFY